jgi:nicotinamide mononucleotide (NMN) deamidase PncC
VGTIHIVIDTTWAAPQSLSYVFPQDRAAVKRRAVTTALGLLRQSLLGYRPEALL